MKKPTVEQIEKAKERRHKMRGLAQRISAMSETERNELAKRVNPATIEGHELSVHNACMLIMQYPGVTLVGGFRQWKRHGRFVNSGPGSGLAIWVPCKRKQKDDNNSETPENDKPGFVLGTVFDVTQTAEMRNDEASDAPIYTETTNETSGRVDVMALQAA